jgi:hypothetical protein
LVISSSVAAQDPQQIGDLTIEYRGQWITWQEGEDVLILVTGSVELRDKDTYVRADRMLAWTRRDDKKAPLRELYVEGNVVSRRVDPKTKREIVLRAERIYYDVVEHRSYIIELSGRTWLDRLKVPVTIRAKAAREATRGTWIAEDVAITTCSYGTPHYHVHFDRAQLRGRSPSGSASIYDLWPYSDWTIRGEGIAIDLFGARIPIWPGFEVDSTIAALPIRGVRGGHSKRFGYWVETDWGVKLSKKIVDWLNPFDGSGPEDDDKQWGELNWELDYRRRRGAAGGLDLRWKWANYWGYIDSYYLRDDGGDASIDFDRQFIGQYGDDRGRARLFHRHQLSAGWRAEAEVSYLSDRALLPEFFEKEFKEDKEQETVGYVRWIEDNMGAYLLERNRLNDFQTQNEFLPRARYFLFDWPAVLGISATVHADAARIRARFDEDLHLSSRSVQRLDLVTEVSRPLDLWLVSLAPIARARKTAWDEDLEDESEYRFLASAGVRLSVPFTAVHDWTWEAIGLRKLRHIAILEATWSTNFANTLDPDELFPFDNTDRLDRFEEVSIEMRHRFQTKRKTPDGALVSREFASLGAAVEYYPDSDRDTTTLRADNYEPPFHWIALANTDAAGSVERRLWSNIHYDARVEPLHYFSMSAYGEYNPVDRQEEVRVYAVSLRPTDTITATVGEVFVKGVTTAFTVGIDWRITEKWRVEAGGQYDFDQDKFLNWRAVVTRDFHDFNLEVVAEVDETRDERRFYVTAYPKFIRRPRP